MAAAQQTTKTSHKPRPKAFGLCGVLRFTPQRLGLAPALRSRTRASNALNPAVASASGWRTTSTPPPRWVAAAVSTSMAYRTHRDPFLLNEVFDEYKFLEIRPHPNLVLRVSVFRPELYGLVRARPTGCADRHRSRPDRATARSDGRHADSRRRRAAFADGLSGGSPITQNRRPDWSGDCHRGAVLRLADRHQQL